MNAGDTIDVGSVPGWTRSPAEGNGNSLQYSYLGNPMDRGAWWAIAHGVSKRVRQDLVTKEHLKVKVKVAHWCPSFCNPIDYTVHGILQARILEWVGFPFSRWPSQSGIEPRSPTLQADCLPSEPPEKPKNTGVGSLSLLQWIFPTQELTGVSCTAGRFFTNCAIREAQTASGTNSNQAKQSTFEWHHSASCYKRPLHVHVLTRVWLFGTLWTVATRLLC